MHQLTKKEKLQQQQAIKETRAVIKVTSKNLGLLNYLLYEPVIKTATPKDLTEMMANIKAGVALIENHLKGVLGPEGAKEEPTAAEYFTP